MMRQPFEKQKGSKVKKLSPDMLNYLGISNKPKPEKEIKMFKDGYGEEHPISYEGYLMIERYLNPKFPSQQELDRRKKVKKLEQRRLLAEAQRLAWERKYGRRRVKGSGIERTEGEIEALQTDYELQYGIGLWQIGDSFIVQ